MDVTTIELQTKGQCKRIWDVLATEYYSELHQTSRNFDRIISCNILRIFPKLSAGMYLDLGGGRGRLEELYSNLTNSIVVGDFSLFMMKTKGKRFDGNPRIQMDAFYIPIRTNTFDGVFSLIGDSYAKKKVFEEVLRVLKPDGFFLLTLPAKIWRQNLLSFLRIEEDETIFNMRSGKRVKVSSFLYTSSELRKMMIDSGFAKVEAGEWTADELVKRQDFSEHVLIAARRLGIPAEQLPLVTYAIAFKNLENAKKDKLPGIK